MSCKKIRSPYERIRVSIGDWGPSMTDTTHAEAADINYIVARYARSGELPPVLRQPQFGDVTRLQMALNERIEFAQRTIAEVQQLQQQAQAAQAAAAASTASSGEAPT